MVNWDEINCHHCNAKCNQKGYPSAMKGSIKCRSQREGGIPEEKKQRLSFLRRFFAR